MEKFAHGIKGHDRRGVLCIYPSPVSYFMCEYIYTYAIYIYIYIYIYIERERERERERECK